MGKRAFALIFLSLFLLLISFVSAETAISCQQIGTDLEGWYQNEQRIINASCANCKAACEYTGTQQEGWYSSCDKSLIKQEICLVNCYSDTNCPTKTYNSYCKELQACTETTIHKCENAGTTLSKCVASSPTISCTDCLYGCSDGSCKSQEPQTLCIDSDGEDYYIKGYVKTAELGEVWDSCAGIELRECICRDGKFDRISYVCLQDCQDGRCIKQETWTGLVHIEIVESICEACTSTPEKTCRCDSVKLYNAKVHLYDTSGNLISSGDTSKGYAEFSELKEGRYIAKLYADGYTSDKAEINLGPNIGNYHTITLKKAGTATGNIKITVQDKINGNILTNAKVAVQDSYGNSVASADTSAGSAVFYSLKEGKYIAIAYASDYNKNKAEFKIIGSESDYLTIGLEQIQQSTSSAPVPSIYWYGNAYWQCYDGYEEKQGGETSCKPAEVWKNYGEDVCKGHCSKETGKCGVNSFKIYNECSGSSNVQPSVCGNGMCESGEGEICAIAMIACEMGKKCEAQSTKKCYYGCEQDCKNTAEEYITAKLNEKFKMQMSQIAKFEDVLLEIKFNDLFVPKCAVAVEENNAATAQPVPAVSTTKTAAVTEKYVAVIEKYDTLTGNVILTGKPNVALPQETKTAQSTATSTPETATQTTASTKYIISKCTDAEPYAVLQIKLKDEKNPRTEVIKLKVGEKRRVLDFAVGFLDYDINGKSGLFVVSREAFECPENCVCDFAGNVTECKKIEKCPKKTMLCPDGVCREKCEIANITTECKFGCFYNEKCLPYGLRINKLYCSLDDNMKSQLTEEACENNFECSTNVCVNGKCISAGMIQNVISWFMKLFGG